MPFWMSISIRPAGPTGDWLRPSPRITVVLLCVIAAPVEAYFVPESASDSPTVQAHFDDPCHRLVSPIPKTLGANCRALVSFPLLAIRVRETMICPYYSSPKVDAEVSQGTRLGWSYCILKEFSLTVFGELHCHLMTSQGFNFS